MEIIIKGVVSGIILAFLIGPVFFTILQTSVERGFGSGLMVAAGVALSDTVYIAIAYLGISQVFHDARTQVYLAYGGGLVLFCLGLYYLLIKSRKLSGFQVEQVREQNPFRLLAKGFFINGLSPMVLVFWLGTVSLATSELGYTTPAKALTFFGAIIGTVFLTDVLKAKLADKLRRILTPRFIRLLNIVLGIVLVIFGGRLILFAEDVNTL
ncbi:MAG: LysE family translocator [Cyclobacteriaceae bacterium]|nr:LysE family translocator [Cyclobacteriaceae bacterium]